MKNLKRHHFFIICALIVLSCKKEKQAHPITNPPVLPPTTESIPKETAPPEKDLYVPIKIEGSELSLTLKYLDNTALLNEILDGNGTKTIITYTTEQQPQKMETYIGKEIHITYYQQDKHNNIIKISNYIEKSKQQIFVDSYSLSYNEQRKISTINHYNNYNILLNANNLQYTESLNLSTLNTLSPENTNTYTYDQKKGISNNIPYSELFTLTIEHSFLLCSGNNLLTILNQKQPQKNINISYEYNEHNYPSNMTINSEKTFKITYKQLKK